MTDIQALLSDEARAALQQLALSQDIDGRRAAALLAVANGQTQAEAAAAHDLTEGQVGYIVRKFHEQGLGAFEASQAAPEATTAPAEDEAEQLRRLVAELNARVAELEGMVGAGTSSDGPA